MATTRGRTWLVRLAALGVSGLLALALLEGLVRATGQDRTLVWAPDSQLGWWHIPGSTVHWREEGDGLVEINSLGMRDLERSVDKPPGVFRIAIFGDSMTEAVQVNLDQTFCQLLETRLARRGLRVEVLNFGVNGYSPLQGYLLYRRVADRFDPDLVLHAVFLDNDVADGDPRLATGQAGAPLVKAAAEGFEVNYAPAEASYRDYHAEPIHTVRSISATYRLISALRWQSAGEARMLQGMVDAGGIPRRYLLYVDPLPDRWEAAWTTLERIEAAFGSEARADGRRFALIGVPAGQVVDRAVWDGLLRAFPAMAAGRWQLGAPRSRFQEIARRLDIPLIEPEDAFIRRLGEGEPLFFGGVGHLTSKGHEVMAAALEDALVALGLLPATTRPAGRD